MPLYRALSAAPAPPAPKPATPPLPAELTDYILDCLEGDRRVLFSCALVCRAWLPRARHHAFRTLHLTPDNVDGFLALLAAPSGTLGRGRTRALHVRQNQTHGREPLLDKLLASPLIPDALAHVEQLTVLYANWTPRAAEARFGAFARVTVLKLCLPGYPSVDDFVDFVCAHPALRELKLDMPRATRAGSGRVRPHDGVPSLEKLTLEHVPIPFMHALAKRVVTPSLRSLAVSLSVGIPILADNMGSDLHAVQQLLDAALYLESFEFRDTLMISGEFDPSNAIDLTKHRDLRCFRLYGLPERMLAPTLSGVSAQVQEVEVWLPNVCEPRDLNIMGNWRTLSEVLDDFQMLRLLTVNLVGVCKRADILAAVRNYDVRTATRFDGWSKDDAAKGIAEELKSLLPSLAQSGRLKVIY
ncbi:hypothetical protein FB107DRAFT_272484 [Schizophyllum commune]